MKVLIILLILVSCGPQRVEIDEVKGRTTHTFGPDFEQWLEYCKGKVNFENEKFNHNYTEEELTYYIEDCYYNLDLDLPELPKPEEA